MATSTTKTSAAKAAEAAKAADAAPDAAVNPTETRLDRDITTPSTTAPGDGPADTTDPAENATAVGGDKAAAALAGHGTVNAVLPIKGNPPFGQPPFEGEGRVETYPATRPDGTVVTVTHNVDTGKTSIAAADGDPAAS